MTQTIDYYFSLISPWTYLGGGLLADMAARHGATVNVKPAKLGTIFPATGGLPLAKRAPARQAYRLLELERWRKRRAIPLTIHPAFFPADETMAAHAVIAAGKAGENALGLSQAILRAVWAEDRNIADNDTLAAIIGEAGLDASALMAAAQDPATADIYEANTQEALERGVFGAPSYIHNGILYWGQDRLDFLDEALAEAK
jgi:2-hydroxychromene-2-carboxylate isomerase